MPTFIKGEALFDITPVENLFIVEYMPKAEAVYVKAYIFGLMQCTSTAAAELDVGAILGIDEAQIVEAFNYWQDVGLVRVVRGAPLVVEYLRPWQSASPASGMPRKYAALVAALRDAAGGRMFTGHELSEIYDWIETFRFTEGAAVLCVKYAIDKHGTKTKLWHMNRIAKLWADNAVITEQDAEALIIRLELRDAGAQAVLRRWKRTRAATEDELALYDKWTLEWGIEESVILSACSEATSAANPSFQYLDAILDTYRINGALTQEGAARLRMQRDKSMELARALFARADIKRAPTLAQREQIDAWSERWHMPAELLMLAADAARDAAQPFAQIKRLVTAWHDEGISTLKKAQADLIAHGAGGLAGSGAAHAANKAAHALKPKSSKRRSYKQHEYTDEELANIGIRLLDD